MEEEGLRGMDPAEEDWKSHDEGANQISHGDTFSCYLALALPPRRTATYASWPSRPRGSLLQSPLPGGGRGWSVPARA